MKLDVIKDGLVLDPSNTSRYEPYDGNTVSIEKGLGWTP